MNVLAFFLAQSESISTYLPREGTETKGFFEPADDE